MPGITGIICKHCHGNEAHDLSVMVKSMMHESFYRSCTFIDNKKGFYAGAIAITGSFSDCMPIYNEKKDLVMFLSGECFVEDETVISLKNEGHEFQRTNASYLIHLYEEMGVRFLEDLNGWFSGIIFDTQEEKAILFNDPYGMQRIYYYEDENSFCFSSEAKALLKIFPSLRNVDMQSMGEYFSYDCVLNNRTFFPNIFLLPGGSSWCFSKSTVNKKRYFDSNVWENQDVLSKSKLFEELKETFMRKLPLYFSGGKIGMSLTGGLDTRMILACLNPKPGELPCYTFGSMYRDSLDVRVARKVAKVCNQTHEVLRLDKKIFAEFPSWLAKSVYISDGLTRSTEADEIYMNSLCRKIAPIRMTGKFGSQVLRGLRGLRARYPNENMIKKDFKEYIFTAKRTFQELDKVHDLSFLLFNEIPWFWAGFASAEMSQLRVRSPYLDNDFVRLLYQAPSEFFNNDEFQLSLIREASPELYSIMTDKGRGGNESKLASIPFKFMYKFLGTADKIYCWDRIPYSLTHSVAKLDSLLHPFCMDRLIRGFGFFRYYRTWFRDELSEYVNDIFHDSRTLNRPYWNKSFLKKIAYDHTNGRGNYLNEIRKILTVELIHRTLIEDI